MSANNPSITVSDITTDVEARLGTPNISTSVYLPWISYAYIRTFNALMRIGQQVQEELFGDSVDITLDTSSPNEYIITNYAPRFSSVIKVEVKYGATGDEYITASKLRSLANWDTISKITTSYRGKNSVLYYIIGGKIGFIPVPPESGATAKLYYVKRPYQLTASNDTIDIPFRFTYPITNYVHAKAIERENEDYTAAERIERKFIAELEEMCQSLDSESNEHEGNYIQDDPSSAIYDRPF